MTPEEGWDRNLDRLTQLYSRYPEQLPSVLQLVEKLRNASEIPFVPVVSVGWLSYTTKILKSGGLVTVGFAETPGRYVVSLWQGGLEEEALQTTETDLDGVVAVTAEMINRKVEQAE